LKQDLLYYRFLRYFLVKLLFLSIYISLCLTKNNSIQLFCVLVTQSVINVSVSWTWNSYPVDSLQLWYMEHSKEETTVQGQTPNTHRWLKNVLFLFSACFHVFHRNLSFCFRFKFSSKVSLLSLVLRWKHWTIAICDAFSSPQPDLRSDMLGITTGSRSLTFCTLLV